MKDFKKYIFIIVLWVITILIIGFTFGSGRLFMIFPTTLASIGYYLMLNGYRGRKNAKNIEVNDLSNLKTGLSKIKGKIKLNEDFKSLFTNENIVFYDIVVEKGEATYYEFDNPKKNPDIDNINDKLVKAKWRLIGRKSEWKEFYVYDGSGEVLVKNPDFASGDWIFDKEQIKRMKIVTFIESPKIIKDIVEESLKNKKKNIEEGRFIRYLERVIKEDDNVIVWGTIEKENNNYIIKQTEDGIFHITNDDDFDLYKFEHKNYVRGLIVFIFGLVGMLIAFFWPISLENAEQFKIN